jgi:putative FmdB family regulatory protein
MPIYEYTCNKCGDDFELLLLDRDEKVKCPACGAAKVKKKMSVFAHKSDDGFTPSSGSSSCSSCSTSGAGCSGCSCS